MLAGSSFGDAGARIVVEEFLAGEEASFIVITDGTHVLPLATSQDHKARDDGDVGPNTGGMGAYSPAPVVTPAIEQQIMDEVIRPTLAGMRADGATLPRLPVRRPDDHGRRHAQGDRIQLPHGRPRNAADHDATLKSDLVETLHGDAGRHAGGADGRVGYARGTRRGYGRRRLSGNATQKAKRSAVSMQPTATRKKCFMRAHAHRRHTVVTNGGRVLCVVGLGATVAAAASEAYDAVEQIHWDDVYFRRDIGHRAIAREREAG